MLAEGFPGRDDAETDTADDFAALFADVPAEPFEGLFTAGDGVLLFVFGHAGHGIALRHDTPDTCRYSVGDPGAPAGLVDVGDETYVPAGACLPPDQAFAVVRAFFDAPSAPPSGVEWVDAESIDWSGVE